MLIEAFAGQDQNLMHTILMLGVGILFFYFILWRPEQKRKKMLEEKKNSIKKGSKVKAMGIVGTVLKVEEDTVVLSTCDSTKIEMLKSAITDVSNPVDDSKDAKAPNQDGIS